MYVGFAACVGGQLSALSNSGTYYCWGSISWDLICAYWLVQGCVLSRGSQHDPDPCTIGHKLQAWSPFPLKCNIPSYVCIALPYGLFSSPCIPPDDAGPQCRRTEHLPVQAHSSRLPCDLEGVTMQYCTENDCCHDIGTRRFASLAHVSYRDICSHRKHSSLCVRVADYHSSAKASPLFYRIVIQ